MSVVKSKNEIAEEKKQEARSKRSGAEEVEQRRQRERAEKELKAEI